MKRILLIPFLAVGTLLAAPELKLELSASQQVERTVDGVVQTSYEASESTQPGDKLAYTITYTNVGDAPAQGAGITGVIPEGTRFLEVLDMPEGTQLSYSVDAGKRFGQPPFTVQVKNTDGSTADRDPCLEFSLNLNSEVGGQGIEVSR